MKKLDNLELIKMKNFSSMKDTYWHGSSYLHLLTIVLPTGQNGPKMDLILPPESDIEPIRAFPYPA